MMNHLEVGLEPDFTELKNGKLYLKVNISIDGLCPLQNNDDDFDICELIQSTKQNGTYFIWTCACGVAGCAGYFKGIHVQIDDTVIAWADEDLDRTYCFDTIKLKNKVHALHEELLKWNS